MNRTTTDKGRDRRRLAGKPAPGKSMRRTGAADAGAERRDIVAVRIEQVREVLGEVLQWSLPADAVLSRWLRQNPKLGSRDRSEVADAVFDVLRHLRRYRHYAQSGSGPAARRLAVLGLASTLGAERLMQSLGDAEQGWLSHVLAIRPDTLPRGVRYSLPDWLDEKLGGMADAEALMEALNQNAPLDIRVNPLKTSRDEVLGQLQEDAYAACAAQATPYSPWGIRLQGRPPLNRWKLFEKGEIEVQDEGSQLLAALVAPKRGEMIIDYCAGAGGKTLLIGALMRSTGRLYAFDVSAPRLARAKPRLARSGLSNVVPVVISTGNDTRVGRLRGKAHRVLVDAPCSGIGTLRRNPDLKWRQHPESVGELLKTQAQILRQAARCVKPGGRLVYATCSLLPEENEQQVMRFLEENPAFRLRNAGEILADRCQGLAMEDDFLRLRPDAHGTDGFFAAVLERTQESTQVVDFEEKTTN
ncbi:RsmB/NOP family class I SAM-dependent RNA methyltransferase [Paracandidimonas soli]|uniref:RsmB/NOP family class I SAM-dependent RNA methyltransferase n=1 Tax=Paracandidimonas soli TaxID=1917182 RepID=UPI003DA70626